MKIYRLIFLIFLILFVKKAFAQVENVPITNSVYTFLKEMKVKGIIPFVPTSYGLSHILQTIPSLVISVNGDISPMFPPNMKKIEIPITTITTVAIRILFIDFDFFLVIVYPD